MAAQLDATRHVDASSETAHTTVLDQLEATAEVMEVTPDRRPVG